MISSLSLILKTNKNIYVKVRPLTVTLVKTNLLQPKHVNRMWTSVNIVIALVHHVRYLGNIFWFFCNNLLFSSILVGNYTHYSCATFKGDDSCHTDDHDIKICLCSTDLCNCWPESMCNNGNQIKIVSGVLMLFSLVSLIYLQSSFIWLIVKTKSLAVWNICFIHSLLIRIQIKCTLFVYWIAVDLTAIAT